MDATYTFSFRVRGGDFDPHALTTSLGLSPRYVRIEGEPIRGSDGAVVGFERRNYWTHTPPNLADGQLVPEIEELLEYLNQRSDVLDDLRNQEAALSIFVGIASAGYSGEEFPANILGQMSALGIGLEIDFTPKR